MFTPFTRFHLARIAFIMILLVSLVGVVPAHAAATITVNSLADSTLNDGVCTLREAIIAANTETASGAAPGECVRGTGADTINIAASLSGGTILLGSALPHITGDLTINGSLPALKVTIDGADSYKIFSIEPGLIVSMSSLIIAHGSDNTGVTFGGGIYNPATLTVIDSAFISNSSDSGGGIFNEGTLTIVRSTFSGNSASSNGGGIMNFAGTLTVTNSTFSGNTAGDGGGVANGGDLISRNNTFSSNSASSHGGGIYSSSDLAMINTIVANSPSGGDCYNDGGSISTNINNLVEDGSCSAALSGDPNLGSLQNNGGHTLTMALGGGSPAMDAGSDADCPLTDQRGVARPQESHCDIGAYESTLIHVNSTADTTANNGACTLREAILAANNDAESGKAVGECAAGKGTDLIDFSAGLSGGTISLGSGLPNIQADVSIDGFSLASKITIDGAGHGSVFSVNSGVNVYLGSLIIAHGNAANGGGIHNSGVLTVDKSLFDSNTGGSTGGAIFNDGTLTVTNSTFDTNTSNSGGGIVNNTGTLTVINDTFTNNSASNDGGAIYNISDTITITNSTFNGNSANDGGGARNLGTLTLINSTFSNNSAVGSGGGIRNGGTLNYTNTILANSTSGGDCTNNLTINTNVHNLVEDGSCSASLSGDPKLGSLQDYGGLTQTMALLSDSPAIEAGSNAACPSADQRGVTRPQGSLCDIGAFEYVFPDDMTPSVSSITRADPNPTSASSVNFTVLFSESVTGVTTDDFVLSTTGVTSPGITGLSGSGTTYTVTVNAGSGIGTIRLDLIDNDSIEDAAHNLLGGAGSGNGTFTGGEQYTISNTFADVPYTHPFYRYIEAFYKAGITGGCSQNPKLYCPNNLVTRAEMAVFIERAKGNFSPTPNPTGMFADMPYLTFTPFIEQLYNDGITTGCALNPLRYCPSSNVTRAAMAAFIERAIGHFNPTPNPTGMFADVPAAGFESLTPFIEQFYNDGITTGCASNPLRYCPANNVTRGEMAVFIVRAFHIPFP